jgi:CBS domain-containing protein
LAEDRDLLNTALGDVCSRDLTTLSPTDAIETAVARMRESAVRRLPVVEEGRPVGILALGDLAVEQDASSCRACRRRIVGVVRISPVVRRIGLSVLRGAPENPARTGPAQQSLLRYGLSEFWWRRAGPC